MAALQVSNFHALRCWTHPILVTYLAITATPAQITRSSDDSAPYTFEETRTRRKNSPGDQGMRRSIQDLVASIDPNVRIEPEVEDVSVTYHYTCVSLDL